jgi:hypothetical protein
VLYLLSFVIVTVYNKALIVYVCGLVIYVETTVLSIDEVVKRLPPHGPNENSFIKA